MEEGKRDNVFDKGVTIYGNITVEEVILALTKYYPQKSIRSSIGESKDDFNGLLDTDALKVVRLESTDSAVTSQATSSR